jgi:hypothetical protein
MKLDQVPLEVHHLTSLLKVLALSRQTDTALGIWKKALASGWNRTETASTMRVPM